MEALKNRKPLIITLAALVGIIIATVAVTLILRGRGGTRFTGNADAPYHEGQFVVTVDCFLVSPNVETLESRVVDTGFAYSDHNPVEMRFKLKK